MRGNSGGLVWFSVAHQIQRSAPGQARGECGKVGQPRQAGLLSNAYSSPSTKARLITKR